jgi:hypothetical protein
MGIWNNMKNAASATQTAATNASSKAMSAARQASASVSDPTKKEKANNAAICEKASNHICNDMGKIPAPGDDMYTVNRITINGQTLPLRIRTPAGTRKGMEYTEQNNQAIRNALISKGIKPAVSNLPAMEQYNKDMTLLENTKADLQEADYQANPSKVHGGRKPRRRTRRHSRKTRGKASSKRSRGAKSKGKRKGSRKRK